MITLLAATLAFLSPAPAEQTVDLIPSDDIWVYPRAADQDRDEYLRIWGADHTSVAASAADSEDFGYALLKFNLADVPKGKTLKTATLMVIHIPKPAYTLAQAKEFPLEVRPMPGGFTEKKWVYEDLAKYMPAAGAPAVFGNGAPEAIDDAKGYPIAVDLLKGPGKFKDYLEAAQKAGALHLALTSPLSPEEGMYKIYSKDGPKESRPILRLTFE